MFTLNGEPSSRPAGIAARVTPPQRGQCPAPAFAGAGSTFHPGHHGAHHREVDLVVTTVQHLIGICQRGLAMRAGGRFRGHRFVRMTGQRTATPFATQATCAWSDTHGLLRLVRLVTLQACPCEGGGWQAGIVRCLRRFVELGFERRHPSRQALHLRPQRPDQSVLLGVAQVAEVGKPGHALV
jgi:hypothetical protein